MTTQLLGNKCDGGHYPCSPPKECCKQGCCYLPSSTMYRPSSIQSATAFNPLFLGHWYFWLAVTATVTGILCACSLWRKHSQGSSCCGDSSRDDRASEPDSNGSCYAPPQYSRCNSFYQAPPPYSEVTSKPDRYPVVISYELEPSIKNTSTGYLMVQYFRKLIVGPTGERSLSATSTNDSINSSFICNVAIEANTIVPPPYSSTASLDEVVCDKQANVDPRLLPHSASLMQQQLHEAVVSGASSSSPSTSSCATAEPENPMPNHHMPSSQNALASVKLSKEATATNKAVVPNDQHLYSTDRIVNKNQTSCDGTPAHKRGTKRVLKQRSSDSESQEESHNFADLLNLSVCMPSNVVYLNKTPIHSNPLLQELHYSVTNSMTGSEVSSLANLDTPDSPPRATSPTLEMKELLNKIQKLPQHKAFVLPSQEARPSRNLFHKMRAKTLYMPLSGTVLNKPKNLPNVSSRSWLSRSAPNTPCANYVPIFPVHKATNTVGTITDGSPLLAEQDDAEDEVAAHRDECL
ncbi:unnamed protein product [Brassicogethes aeneus]|uniref:WW domain binding protein VOPP1 n=1 Tax=Brassicogethes aeneus TaxID=1431903 RepID=A0A9P0B286_BRAAE|nr:unnamed protein product [Brassicogethes aeneus]